MIWPTWESRASTVADTVAPLLISWLISAVSPSSAPDTFSTNSLASVGLMEERTGPSEFKNASMLASVTSCAERDGGAGREQGPGTARVRARSPSAR